MPGKWSLIKRRCPTKLATPLFHIPSVGINRRLGSIGSSILHTARHAGIYRLVESIHFQRHQTIVTYLEHKSSALSLISQIVDMRNRLIGFESR